MFIIIKLFFIQSFADCAVWVNYGKLFVFKIGCLQHGGLQRIEDGSSICFYPEGEESKPGFGAHATTAMFVGLCAAYIGSYVGKAVPREGSDIMPLLVAIVAAIAMAGFEFLIQKKGKAQLENFSLAASMLIAMAAAVVLSLMM